MTRFHDDHNTHLAAIIAAQIDCATRLVGVLEAERVALVAGEVEALEAACSAKALAASQLQQLGERFAAKVGADRPSAEVEALLSREDGGDALVGRWRELGALAARCREANQANGVLLEAREKQVRAALAALQPEPPAVYGRRGGHRASLPSQIVSRA